jgi:hypothetical protein
MRYFRIVFLRAVLCGMASAQRLASLTSHDKLALTYLFYWYNAPAGFHWGENPAKAVWAPTPS